MSQRNTIGPDDRVVPSEHVHCRIFDDDLIMIDLQGGHYFALDGVGARMWELLVSGKTPAEVGSTLAAEYEAGEDRIVGDCTKLAEELLARGLLIARAP